MMPFTHEAAVWLGGVDVRCKHAMDGCRHFFLYKGLVPNCASGRRSACMHCIALYVVPDSGGVRAAGGGGSARKREEVDVEAVLAQQLEERRREEVRAPALFKANVTIYRSLVITEAFLPH